MTKEEYAQLNYLLAKLRYELIGKATEENIVESYSRRYIYYANKIHQIQRFMFINKKEKDN